MKITVIFLIAASPVWLAAQPAYKWSKTETLADTLLNRRQVYDALKLYTKVIRAQQKAKFTGQSAVRFKRALCYYYSADFDRALSDLNIFIEQNPSYLRAHLLRAYVYREMRKPEEQLADLEEILRQDFQNIDLHKWRAGTLLEWGKIEEAKHALETLQEFYNDEEVELNLGLACYYQHDFTTALFHFNQAIFMNGGYLPAYRYATLLCAEQQWYEKALEYGTLALLLSPQDPELLFYKGIALAETGNLDAACSCLNKAFYAGLDEASGYLEHYCYSVDD